MLAWQSERGSRGFTNHEHLNRTGFIHMNGRVYDPRIGRFVSPDPVVPGPTLSQSYNRYAYVYNNPLSYVDPTGYNPLKKIAKGIGKAVGGVFGGLSKLIGNAFQKIGGLVKKYAVDIAIAVVHLTGHPELAAVLAGARSAQQTSAAYRSRSGRRGEGGVGWGTPGIAGPVAGMGFATDPDGTIALVPWWMRWVPMRVPGSEVQPRAVGDPRQVRDGDPEWMFDLADLLPNPVARTPGGMLLGYAVRALIAGVAGESREIRFRIGWQPTILVQDHELFVYVQYVILDPNDTGGIIGGPRPGIGPGEIQTRARGRIAARRENSRYSVFVYDLCLLQACWTNAR